VLSKGDGMTLLCYTCSKQDCAIAVTGKCLELLEPASCPNAKASSDAPTAEKPAAVWKVAARKFPGATEIGLMEAREIMHGKYAHFVGILGAYDAGKTCMLNALYLLAATAELAPRFRFAGSLTLAGFELRTRRLRKWNKGQLPDQLAEHTTHADPRNPGLLHIALSDSKNGFRRIELLLTDLPGEWTTGLIKQSQRAVAFEFLQRADGLVIAVDGTKLRNAATKHAERLSLEHLVDRLADAVNLDRRIPIFLVSCKADEAGIEVPQELEKVAEHARSKGYTARAVSVASFSRKPNDVANGYGIQALVESIVDYESPKPASPVIQLEPKRSFGRSLGTA
jgi:double-GTPase-like protein